jgi:hypothetical protein
MQNEGLARIAFRTPSLAPIDKRCLAMPYRLAEPFESRRLLASIHSPVHGQIAMDLPGRVGDGSSWWPAVDARPLGDVEMISWSAMSMT